MLHFDGRDARWCIPIVSCVQLQHHQIVLVEDALCIIYTINSHETPQFPQEAELAILVEVELFISYRRTHIIRGDGNTKGGCISYEAGEEEVMLLELVRHSFVHVTAIPTSNVKKPRVRVGEEG
jgi:hypothetical protein